jgi:glycosyltransferase involved in cell wall biosynthesis
VKSIYYWSPFLSKVATISAVINSAYSLKKFSKKYKVYLLNSFGEWDSYTNELKKKDIQIINVNSAKYMQSRENTGYLKSRLFFIVIFIINFLPLLKILVKKKPDYLIIHLITSLPLVLKIIFKFPTKLILRISGFPKLNLLRKFFWRVSSKYIEYITCPTLETLEYLKKNKIFHENKLILLRDPVIDINQINLKKKDSIDFNFDENFKYIIAIGRLTKQKNFAFLIKGLKDIDIFLNQYKLLILGDGEDYVKLNDLINSYNLKNNVYLLGYQENVYKFFKKASFFILTSLWEDPGFVLIESAACNKAILSSNCSSGPKEFLNNEERGYIYEKNNINDFKCSFLRIIKDTNKISYKRKIYKAKNESRKYTKLYHFLSFEKILK